MSDFQEISIKDRPQRTAEVLPTVVRCSPPPLRSGSVGRPTHRASIITMMEFSAGRPPAAPSLDIVQELRRSCGLRPPLRRRRLMSRTRFFPNLCRPNYGSFMQAAFLHVGFFRSSHSKHACFLSRSGSVFPKASWSTWSYRNIPNLSRDVEVYL